MHNPLTAVLSQDQADLIAFMILTVPLSFLLLRLTNKWAFLCFSVSFTILFQSVLFPEEKYFLWGQQLIVFLLIRLVPQKHAGKIIFAESSVVLLLVQLRRMSLSYG